MQEVSVYPSLEQHRVSSSSTLRPGRVDGGVDENHAGMISSSSVGSIRQCASTAGIFLFEFLSFTCVFASVFKRPRYVVRGLSLRHSFLALRADGDGEESDVACFWPRPALTRTFPYFGALAIRFPIIFSCIYKARRPTAHCLHAVGPRLVDTCPGPQTRKSNK